MEAQIRKVMPPHPGASITYEQAVAAWKKVAEEDRQRRLRRNAVRRAAYYAKKSVARQEFDELCARRRATRQPRV